jgi:DNA repair protein SbcC/Rad50
MRPLTLRMTGLRSYRVERIVDFTGLSLVAIIGQTGAGKSSLLEAITYALYGASTWDKRAVKELISDAAVSMRVSLEFEADGERWQVTRMISRKTGASHELTCLSNPEVAKIDGDRQVNARIEKLVGLDYDGFCACVLLPQGRFEQLLKATKKDRAAILKGILRLDELDLMRERASELARRLTPRCEEIQAARAQFLPDPASTRDQAAARQEELEPRRQALEQARTTVETLIEEVAEHTRIARDASAGADRVNELLDPDLLGRLRALDALDGELAAEQLTATEAAERAAAAAAAAEETVAALRAQSSDSASIITATNTLVTAREDLAAITEEMLQLAETRGQLAGEIEAHTTQTAQLASLEATVTEHEQALTARQQTLTGCTQSCAELIAQITATIAARMALELARGQEERAQAEHAIQLTAATNGAERLTEAELAAANTRASLADRHRLDLAAQLAHSCQGGEPCPVCARPLPEPFTAPALPDDLQALTAALADAEAAEQAARKLASTQSGASVTTERALAAAGEQLASCRTTWEEQLSIGLPQGLNADTVELDEATSEQVRAPEHAARTQLETAQRELEDARSQHTRLQASCETASRALEQRAEALTAAGDGLERRRALVRRRLALLPAWLELDDSAAGLDAAAQRLAARLAEAEEDERTTASTQRAVASAQEATRAIESRIRQEVREPAATERTALANLAGELTRHQIELSATPDATAPIAELSRWAGAVLDAAVRDLTRLTELSLSETTAASTKTETGRATVATLGFENSRQLQQALIEITAEQIAATREHASATSQIEPTEQLDALLGKARGLRDALSELARQLADAKFVGFVVERRQRALLTAASGILSQMTSSQFGFTEDFQIIDRRSDMARSPDTLSGGETFLASLALALGLVELAGRSGGRLQALFLDEGFGSLDPDALEQALNELERRARAGRLIALISHVPAVAERIDQILQVTKTPQGSDIHLLDDAERQALLLQDATEAAIAAR